MRLFSIQLDTLRDLYLNQLRDLYSGETQLVEALPDMAEAATAPDLKRAFQEHLEQTKNHVQRLGQIFDRLNESHSGETCEAMEGLIEEGTGYVKASGNPHVRDAALIAAGQRVEHYEIAAYGTVRELARQLGDQEAAQLLQTTLDEEAETDRKLTSIAESHVNAEAGATQTTSR